MKIDAITIQINEATIKIDEIGIKAMECSHCPIHSVLIAQVVRLSFISDLETETS